MNLMKNTNMYYITNSYSIRFFFYIENILFFINFIWQVSYVYIYKLVMKHIIFPSRSAMIEFQIEGSPTSRQLATVNYPYDTGYFIAYRLRPRSTNETVISVIRTVA